MTRLLRAELARLFSRRMFRLLTLALFAGLLTVAVKTAVSSNHDLAAAHARAARQAAHIRATMPEELKAACAGHGPTGPGATPGLGAGPECPPLPTAAQLFQDPRFSFAASGRDMVNGAVIVVALLGLVLGASAVGAEWAAGTFGALLTWEPRRLRVAAAKLFAAVGVMLLVGVLAIGFEIGAGLLIAATSGTLQHVTTGFVTSLTLRGLRGLGLISLLAAVGAAIAGISRHTAAALGLAVGYLVAFEMVLRGLRPQWERWLFSDNAAAILNGKTTLPGASIHEGAGVFTGNAVFTLSATRGAVYLTLVVLGLLAVTSATLIRRDVA